MKENAKTIVCKLFRYRILYLSSPKSDSLNPFCLKVSHLYGSNKHLKYIFIISLKNLIHWSIWFSILKTLSFIDISKWLYKSYGLVLQKFYASIYAESRGFDFHREQIPFYCPGDFLWGLADSPSLPPCFYFLKRHLLQYFSSLRIFHWYFL